MHFRCRGNRTVSVILEYAHYESGDPPPSSYPLINHSIGTTMERSINATETRIHFGELMRRVVEHDEPVIVEGCARKLL